MVDWGGMSHHVRMPPPVRPGIRVAVVSPSWCGPELFPAVHEQALARIRALGLEPVEYPTTRVQGTPVERARDLSAAFADPTVRAVLATVGGDDQLTVLPHLDEDAMTADPKRFVGYSDNTNLANWLWWHGIGSVYGGSTMVHLGPGPEVDPEHLATLRAALFGGDVELVAPRRTRDFGVGWDHPDVLSALAPDLPAEPWTWAGPRTRVTGPVWGGCLESVEAILAVGRWLRPSEDHAGSVLALEASEERPSAEDCFRMLRNLGERGLLAAASALLWGRPPVAERDDLKTAEEASTLRAERREAVLRAVAAYHPGLVTVLDVDFGHTSPQLVLPYGGEVTVDAERRTITAHFGDPAPAAAGVSSRT